jgi:glutathione S-transferase
MNERLPIRVFTAIPFSPWSEKARWALDHHHVDYREAPFMPVFGEFALRLRMRKPFGRITVPTLQHGRLWLTDSFEIARYSDEIGDGPALFPTDRIAEISAWNQRSEAALAAGRAILMQGWASTPELATAALPPGLPPALKGLLEPFGRRRLDAFMAKYDIREGDDSYQTALAAELDELEKALSERRYLIGDSFTYADITMALTLQQVAPVDPSYIVRMSGLGPAGMNIDTFTTRYAALIAWRDDLYARHRRTSESAFQERSNAK